MKRNFSVGTDIVEVSRIRRLIRNKRFLNRIYTSQEIRYCKSKKNAAQHFAVRFAAKESVWKALSLVNLKGVGHKEIGVGRLKNGQPYVVLSKRINRFEKYLSLSLSHSNEYATAVVLFHPS